MKIETVAIDSVQRLIRNPRRHPERQIEAMVTGIEMFGQYRPLVVDEKGDILAGNGLHLALERSGATKVAIHRKTGLTQDEKTKLVLYDNRSSDLSSDDYEVIEELLGTLSDFEVPGFDPDMIRELMSSAEELGTVHKDYGIIPDEVAAGLRAKEGATDEENSQAPVGKPPAPLAAAPDDEEALVGEPGEVCPTCHRAW